MTPRLASAAVLVLVAATACSGSSSSSSSPAKDTPASSASSASAADSGPTLTIKGFRYSALQVAPGTTITVKNLDDAEHTVTSDKKGLFAVEDIASGKPKTFTAPTTPGTYTFYCQYHASMHGSLTVS
jgi:plastocyanin